MFFILQKFDLLEERLHTAENIILVHNTQYQHRYIHPFIMSIMQCNIATIATV